MELLHIALDAAHSQLVAQHWTFHMVVPHLTTAHALRTTSEGDR